MERESLLKKKKKRFTHLVVDVMAKRRGELHWPKSSCIRRVVEENSIQSRLHNISDARNMKNHPSRWVSLASFVRLSKLHLIQFTEN